MAEKDVNAVLMLRYSELAGREMIRRRAGEPVDVDARREMETILETLGMGGDVVLERATRHMLDRLK